MYPVIYIPLWLNLILFISGMGLLSLSFYFLIKKECRWFLTLPIFAYSVHFSTFYGFVSFSQLTYHVLSAETMTLWSAILRFQGVITWISMLLIIYFTCACGERDNG